MRKKRDRLKNFCINTDHLGNTRVSFQDADGNGSIAPENEVVEVNDYYPYGMLWQTQDRVVGGNLGDKFKFNGVELNETLGLYEMPFRQYDPAIGRFTGMDALSEQAMNITPYRFGFNNPNLFADPSGLWEETKDGYVTSDQEEIASFLNLLKANSSSNDSDSERDTGECCDDNDKDLMSGMAKGAFGGAKHAQNLADNGQHEQAQKIHDKIDKQTENLEQYWESLSIIPGSSLVKAFGQSSQGNFGAAIFYAMLGVFDLSGGGALKPLGLGSTGRTIAKNLTEKLAMKEIMSNPSALGKAIPKMKPLSDPRWKGWIKMSNRNAHGVEIHFNAQFKNGKIINVDDFKFIGQ